jgi:hypothetical protein
MGRRRSLRRPATRRSTQLSSSRGTDLVIRRIVPVAYLLIGLIVAYQHSYLTNLTTLGRVLSAVLAVVLWPLVLLGVHLNIA